MCEITTLLHQVVKIGHEVNSSVLCFQYGANYGIYELSKTTILENLNINNGVKSKWTKSLIDSVEQDFPLRRPSWLTGTD